VLERLRRPDSSKEDDRRGFDHFGSHAAMNRLCAATRAELHDVLKRLPKRKESTPKTRQHAPHGSQAEEEDSNEDWKAQSTRRLRSRAERRTHGAGVLKPRNAVDMETGAIVAVTTHGGALPTRRQSRKTVVEAAIAVAGL